MIATPDFSPADLERRMSRFNRWMVAAVLGKTIRFLLRHPIVWLRLARTALRYRQELAAKVAKRLFFAGLFYKFNYLRRL